MPRTTSASSPRGSSPPPTFALFAATACEVWSIVTPRARAGRRRRARRSAPARTRAGRGRRVMSRSSTPRAASGAQGQFRVEQQGPPDYDALTGHQPRADIAEFAVLHHELDLSLFEHAGFALDEHEGVQ